MGNDNEYDMSGDGRRLPTAPPPPNNKRMML
jgi:hypothetical protein